MRRYFLQCLLAHLCVCLAYGQSEDISYIVQGQVVDSTTLTPIPYANILVHNENGDYSNGTTSGLDGNFSIQLKSNAAYVLEISCISYISSQKRISSLNKNTQIGTIKLKEDNVQLAEVAVIGRKERIKLSPSGLTYEMKNDPLSQSENLLFALRNVPLITVDGEGGIRVKGSPSFSIYLNGKPYRMATLNPKSVLQSIPAASISKIELITQLDARYDASAGNAIINIITDRKSLDGYKVLIHSSGETHPKAEAGTSVIITKGKFDLSLSYDYQYTHESNQKAELNRDNMQDGEVVSKLRTHQTDGIGDYQYHTGRGMLTYNIDTINSLYADAHIFLNSIYSEMANDQLFETTTKQYSRNKEIINTNAGASEFNVVYQNLYKRNKSERFTFGYRYAYNPDKRNTELIRYGDPTTGDEESNLKELTRQRDKTNGGLHEHTLQLDYRLPLNKRSTLRFGAKDVLRKANATPTYWLWDQHTQGWVENAEESAIGSMNQTQNIASAYLTYNYRKGKWSFNLGGRLEYSHNQIAFKENAQANFTSDLVDLIPRCNLSWNVSGSSQLGLTLSSGVTRPSIWNLNPFRQQSNEFQLEYGNPDLKSEKRYNAGLSYMKYSNQWFVSLNLDYNHTKDAIVKYPFRDEQNPKLLLYTYGNMGSYQRLGSSVFINYKPIPALSLSANGTLTQNKLKSKILDLKQKEMSYNASLSCDASLAHNWLLGGRWSIFQRAPQIRTSYTNFQSYSFYAYKRFMDGNLSIGVIANQPFTKRFNSTVYSTGDDFVQSRTNHIRARSFGVNLSYSFGAGKQSKIKRNKTIQNEDIQQGTGVR